MPHILGDKIFLSTHQISDEARQYLDTNDDEELKKLLTPYMTCNSDRQSFEMQQRWTVVPTKALLKQNVERCIVSNASTESEEELTKDEHLPLSVQQEDNCPSQSLSKGQSVCQDDNGLIDCRLKEMLKDPLYSTLLSCPLVATAEACTGIPALYSACCDACSAFGPAPEGATCRNDDSAVIPTLLEQDYTCMRVAQLIPCYMMSIDEVLLETFETGCMRTWYDQCMSEEEQSASVCAVPEVTEPEAEEEGAGDIESLQEADGGEQDAETEGETEEKECEVPPAEITECTDSDAQVECGLKQLLEDPMISPLLSCGLVATAEACTGIPALYSTCCDACSDYASLPEGATCGNDESAVVPTLMEQDYTCEGVLQLIPCYMLSFDESLLQTYKSGCTRTWYDKCAMESEKSELASVCDAPEEGGSGIQVLQFQKDPSNFFFDVVQDPVAPEPEQSASVPPQQRRLR
uniref:Uncharacterized protein n=1 Tax=Chromera velia CCMP2878 TaxID=1169474 RepID=A0A0G4HES1_9ALVE|eukprot:Cvel_26720.t1-p1 / transcript=Cvel_26720.t1 / gene=Cvel_26720 / organism=Chromera_velia_CCMP2878 / gene_product=hypothetical protein / transcript_product=hypothetical protein / location=Cvel_scaffold3223:9962-18726(+) / protein_length=463 / sequence_SO=supercontig / SO=protein_coding / is_pseudo=false